MLPPKWQVLLFHLSTWKGVYHIYKFHFCVCFNRKSGLCVASMVSLPQNRNSSNAAISSPSLPKKVIQFSIEKPDCIFILLLIPHWKENLQLYCPAPAFWTLIFYCTASVNTCRDVRFSIYFLQLFPVIICFFVWYIIPYWHRKHVKLTAAF